MLTDDLQIDEGISIRVACSDSTDVLSDSDLNSIKQVPQNKLDRSTRINPDIVATLVASLRTKVIELEAQWRDLSVSNGARVSNAISEHKMIMKSSSEIQRSANDMTASMQRLGSDFSERIHALVELDVAYTRLVDAKSLFDRLLRILVDIQHIYDSMKQEEWYHAAKLYRCACYNHRDFLQSDDTFSLADEKGKQQNEDGATNNIKRSFLNDQYNLIPRFLLTTLDGIEHHLTQRVSSMLTEWFSLSNSLYEQLGRDAMSICASENATKIVELEEKQKLFNRMVQHGPSVDAVVSSDLVSGLTRVRQNRREVRKLADHQLELASSNLDILLTATSIEEAFLDSSKLTEEYIQGQEGQLASLLVPPCRAEQEGKYFHKLVGFFLVEIDICINIPWLGTKQYLQTIWEGTSSAIMAEIGAMLDEALSPQGMVDLKTHVLHASRSLDRYEIDTINPKPLLDVCLTRLGKFINLLHEPTMVALETSEGDADLLTVSVRACLNNITNYLEGIVPNNNLQHIVLAEADKMFSNLLLPVLSTIADEESCDNGVPEKLLAFIESTAFIQELLLYNTDQISDSANSKRYSLGLLLYDAICLLASILAKKIVAEAMESLLVDNINICPQPTLELISSWSDSIIEQFEFYRQEFGEFEFGEHLENQMLALLADKIVMELCLDEYAARISERGVKALSDDLDALRKTFTSVGLRTENNVLPDMLNIVDAISNGNRDLIQTITNARMDKHLARFFITILEHYPKFLKDSSNQLDKAAIKSLANGLKSCSLE